jgi:hypothetical protein
MSLQQPKQNRGAEGRGNTRHTRHRGAGGGGPEVQQLPLLRFQVNRLTIER